MTRPPGPALAPFVRQLWATEPEPGTLVQAAREHVLPTGRMHLAIRLSGPALRIFENEGDASGRSTSHAVVGGPRSSFYIRESGPAARSVGVLFEPVAARALFGAMAGELAHRHTPLQDLWGAAAGHCMDCLDAAPNASSRLDLLELLLAARLRAFIAPHAGVTAALHTLHGGRAVRDAVRASGLSHRRLLTLFRDATGLAPKEHARVLRLQRALRRLAEGRSSLSDVADDGGFSDQAHFQREFRAFAGVTPGAFLRAAPAHPHHVPVGR